MDRQTVKLGIYIRYRKPGLWIGIENQEYYYEQKTSNLNRNRIIENRANEQKETLEWEQEQKNKENELGLENQKK